MKKILGIVVLGLFLSGNAYAGCKSDIDWKWYTESKNLKGRVGYEFKNKGSKHIRITEIEIIAKDGDVILSFKPSSWDFDEGRSKGFFVSPGKKSTGLKVNSNAYRYGKTARYDCKYQKPWKNDISDIFSNTTDSVSDTFDDLNPLNYFKKRKKCQEFADRADTVAIGKRWYKNCMEEG